MNDIFGGKGQSGCLHKIVYKVFVFMPENGIACNCHMARKLLNNKNSFYERVEFTKILGTKPHKLPYT